MTVLEYLWIMTTEEIIKGYFVLFYEKAVVSYTNIGGSSSILLNLSFFLPCCIKMRVLSAYPTPSFC
jgi:hypothetical protein